MAPIFPFPILAVPGTPTSGSPGGGVDAKQDEAYHKAPQQLVLHESYISLASPLTVVFA